MEPGVRPLFAMDPLPLLRAALDCGDRALAEALIERFAASRTLSRRAMRDLAGLEPAAPARTYEALVLMLGLGDRER